ncbi:hypothetical protein NITHO_3510006 [Nitrolancea hollandica Lb]|uniref:Uncharacterized protein n=1 Tax=Nitrolancea hollandica Lb TaxID=1129897 RepID=I4EII9_9BACT|nr:hypothetical protein NITHO_3510006 [Nitrolancea hollandica Lb]
MDGAFYVQKEGSFMRFSGHRAQITRSEYTGLWSLGGCNIPLLSRRGTGVVTSRWGIRAPLSIALVRHP